MNKTTRKLTTAAVCTALAVIMCAMSAYLPLSFMPLYLAAFCIFIACKRAGAAYGALCAAASVGLMFLMSGLSVKWLALVIMFVPYGIICSFVDKYGYFKPKTAIIRGVCAILYFNLAFGAVFATVSGVASVGLDGLDILAWANKAGGYAVLAVIATAVLVPLDFIFTALGSIVLKKIPAIDVKKPPASDVDTHGGEEKKYDDVFGYEIVSDSGETDGNTDDGTNTDKNE